MSRTPTRDPASDDHPSHGPPFTDRDHPGRNKHDRELEELLQELRVMIPGAEILFAFLLTVPFTDRFPDLPGYSRGLFMVTLGASALAIGMFIAPTAFHRIRWRAHDKERLLRNANRLAITGAGFLALAIGTGLFIVADLVYGLPVGIGMGAGITIVLVVLWYVIPLLRGQRRGD